MGCGAQSLAVETTGRAPAWQRFSNMIPNALGYAHAAKAQGCPVVGIMCEYTPREIIMAAGAVPVCLCGGSHKTIAAAEQDLPANLCPLIKSTYGYHVLGTNPFLEMTDLVVADTTCDGKKKMFELMGQKRAMHVLELPHKPDGLDAAIRWRAEFAQLQRVLEGRFNVQITDRKLRDAIALMNRERTLRRALADLMQRPAPPLTGRQLLDLRSIISCIPEDLAAYEAILAELSERQMPADGRVRVLLTGVPTAHGAEKVVDIIEQNGGLVCCIENCSGLKPVYELVDETDPDPLMALARKYLNLPCSVMTDNRRRLDLLRMLARAFRPDCIVELIWQACLTYDVESYFTRQLAERELGLGYLRIETDYSPSDAARISTRLQALFETTRH